MSKPLLSVRELQEGDIHLITAYWLNSDRKYLEGLGVDISKVPGKEEWKSMLMEQLSQPIKEKKSYCIIWEVDNKPVGHCNINKIVFGEEAYMHIHIWYADIRKQGFGVHLIKLTIPWFFTNYNLKKLFCEPYALNTAPNKTLEKLGFDFVKAYKTTPGWINFEQQVNLWQLSYDKFKQLTGSH